MDEDASTISNLLDAFQLVEVHINTVAAALGARYTIAAYCATCRRWATLDLRRMTTTGQGELAITALKVRCQSCGKRGALQVRPRMPTIEGFGRYGVNGCTKGESR